MVIKANIVETKEINVNLNQGTGGFNSPVQSVNNKTGHVVLDANDVGALPKSTVIPTKVSQLENDEEYLKSYTETDPTVPAWAKTPQKPSYTFAEVGADPKGAATEAVNAHNTSPYSHQDIRILIDGLTSRLNALADSDDVTLDQMSELVAYIKDNRELIEGVTTNKVNVSDIINNLTTNVANKPLSAAQGVVLRNLIENIKMPTNLSDLKDDSTHRVVSDAEKARWNSKSEFSGSYKDLFDQPFGETWLSSGSDTLTSDNIIYGGYHKAGNAVPSMGDIEKGYTIKYYRVSNGVITGDSITLTNSNADMSVRSGENGILISYDGLPLVIVSFTGIGTWSALNFSDITSPGVYFLQDTNICVESIKLTDYDGFPLKVMQGGVVKTVNHVVPDENGNVNVEGGSGGSSDAFDLVKSGTLTWNGDTEGKVVATNAVDSSFYYVRVSSVVPTMATLQNGGSWATVGDDGIEYEEPFTSEDISETSNLIDCFGGYILIAKEDNVRFFTDFADATLPKAGIYFVNFADGGYVSKLTIANYMGFTKPMLKKECMPVQYKDWYGQVVTDGNTAVSDGIIHGGYVKVSDAVPTEEELRKGGTIRHYNVENNQLSGDLILGDYLGDDYGITVRDEAIFITYGLEVLAIISINGSPKVGPLVIDAITSPGVYFVQNKYSCVHSLTINEYTGFDNNLEKIPAELLPDNIGGGASSWNDLTDKPFGETTTYSDAITWDGNTEGLYNPTGTPFYHVSDVVPTVADLQKGGTLVLTGTEMPFTSAEVIDLESLGMGADCVLIGDLSTGNVYGGVVFKEGATANLMGYNVTFEKAGTYFLHNVASQWITTKLTFNDYTFTETKIIHLDTKFLKPFEVSEVNIGEILTWDGNTKGLYNPVGSDLYHVSDAIPTYEDLTSADVQMLLEGIKANGETEEADTPVSPVNDTDYILLANGLGIIIKKAGTGWGDMIFEKTGVYFGKARITDASGNDVLVFVKALGIRGYNFTKEQQMLKPEYMPTDAINEMILAVLTEKGLVTE